MRSGNRIQWFGRRLYCAALELGTRLTNSRPGGELYHLLTELGQAVAEDRFAPVASADRGAVAMAESLLAI